MDFLFRALPDELAPFDYEAFGSPPRTLVTGVTDCTTGAARFRGLGRVLLRRYPALYAALLRRPAAYNASLDLVERMERAGSAFVIRPVRHLVVGRLERGRGRLEALYRQGYDETVARMPELEVWLRGWAGRACGALRRSGSRA